MFQVYLRVGFQTLIWWLFGVFCYGDIPMFFFLNPVKPTEFTPWVLPVLAVGWPAVLPQVNQVTDQLNSPGGFKCFYFHLFSPFKMGWVSPQWRHVMLHVLFFFEGCYTTKTVVTSLGPTGLPWVATPHVPLEAGDFPFDSVWGSLPGIQTLDDLGHHHFMKPL